MSRIARAIHGYARKRGWGPSDYRIAMRYNPDYDVLQVTLLSAAFRGLSEDEAQREYDDVMDEIDKALGKRRFFNYDGLVLTWEGSPFSDTTPRPGTADVEVDEELINESAPWAEPPSPAPR